MKSTYDKIAQNIRPDEESKRTVKTSALFTSLIGGTAAILLGKRLTPAMSTGLFFGLSTALSVGSDIARKSDPKVAIVSNLLASSAGYAAFSQRGRVSDIGVKTLKSFIGSERWDKLSGFASRISSAHPILEGLFTKNTIGMALAVATIPIAHTIVQRSIAKYRRDERSLDPTINTQMHNQAGQTYNRFEGIGDIPYDPHSGADVRIRGRVQTIYNNRLAVESITK